MGEEVKGEMEKSSLDVQSGSPLRQLASIRRGIGLFQKEYSNDEILHDG